VHASTNKNITKKDPPQQPHHGLDKKITTEEDSEGNDGEEGKA